MASLPPWNEHGGRSPVCCSPVSPCWRPAAAAPPQDRFDLVTERSDAPVLATPDELAILRSWGEHLRLRDAVGASRDFVVPAYVADGESGWVELSDREAVERFNRGFTPQGLLASPASYRLAVFKQAAFGIDLIPIAGILNPIAPIPDSDRSISIDSTNLQDSLTKLDLLSSTLSDLRVIAVDDSAVELAALMTDHLGQIANGPDAALASRNKIVMRQRFAAAGLPNPNTRPFNPSTPEPSPFPFSVVVKPSSLNGSRGVIRADDPLSFAIACQRLNAILQDEGAETHNAAALVETFIPGQEVAIEAVMTAGLLTVLAIFDKPDPLDGPFFEETIYVTRPTSSHRDTGSDWSDGRENGQCDRARHGPIHAEVRLTTTASGQSRLPPAQIGGMCSSVLDLGQG